MNARQRRKEYRKRPKPAGYRVVPSPDASCCVNGQDCAMRRMKWQDGCKHVYCTSTSRNSGLDVIFIKK